MSQTSPAAVSARLRKAGFAIVATRNRQGIRVSRGALAGTVSVSVDLDRAHEGSYLADALAEHFATWEGYTITRVATRFTVAKEEA